MKNRNYKALVLDDEYYLGEVLTRALEDDGIDATAVSDVDSAIDALNKQSFDVVISDIYLPQKTGEDFFEYALKHHPDLPFIFITGNPNLETAVNFLKKGAYDYLAKPFRIPQFLEKVHTVLKESQRRRKEKHMVEDLRNILNHRLEELQIYRDIFESEKQGLLILDSEGTIVRVSPGVEKFIGVAEENLRNQPLSVLNDYLEPKLDFEAIRRTVQNSGQWKKEWRTLSSQNSTKPKILKASIIGVQNEGGATFAYSVMMDDVTAFREVETALIDSLKRSNLAQEAIIFGLARLAEYRDQETGYHLERIRSYCKVFATALLKHPKFCQQVNEQFIDTIYRTAPLHDIGKVGIPDYILLKPDKLSAAEYEIMKTHTIIGYQTLNSIREQYGEMDFLNMGIDITYCHHEKYDGTGYPQGLQGNDIPLSAKIVAIADVYDALTSQRTYKKAFPHHISLNTMRLERGKHFDPELFDVFLTVADQFDTIRKEFKAREKQPAPDQQLKFNDSPWDWLA